MPGFPTGNTMGIIIDSSVLIELERRGLPLGALAAGGLKDPLAISSMVAAELLAGVERADSEPRRAKRRAYIESLLDCLPVIPFDLAAARIYAGLWQQLSVAGTPIGSHDLIIGATALAYDYAVLTCNPSDFAKISNLILVELSLPIT